MAMKHLSAKSFLERHGINFIKDDQKDVTKVDYIWGDTSDLKKVKFLVSLIENKFSNGKILEIGTYRGTTTYSMASVLDKEHHANYRTD